MPPVNILIKPASSRCNMRCRYCFYHDIAQHREHADMGILQEDTMKMVIRRGIDYADHLASFTFQGGEPTVAGLSFFQRVVEEQERQLRESGKKNLRIQNAIQTNGYVMDEAWAGFFHQHDFLVGLSMDGPANVHDKNRVDSRGQGTFQTVMRAVELLEKYHVRYNILSVVTGQNALSAKRIYRFFAKQKFRYLQFIPCLEPVEKERGDESYHLSVQQYGDFLINIFDEWFADFKRGEYISIRQIDNWIFMLLGEPPEACNMNGRCSVQFVVEGDGSVYPCDFYVFDKWKLGNVKEHSFQEMEHSKKALQFVEKSLPVPQECQACRYRPLCRNGCRRDRVWTKDMGAGKNYYCEAVYRFFSERERELLEAVEIVREYHRKRP